MGVLNVGAKALKFISEKLNGGKMLTRDFYIRPQKVSTEAAKSGRGLSENFAKLEDLPKYTRGDRIIGSNTNKAGTVHHYVRQADGTVKKYGVDANGNVVHLSSGQSTEAEFNSIRNNSSRFNSPKPHYDEALRGKTKALLGGATAATGATGYYIMSPSQEENLAESANPEDVLPNNPNSGKDEEKAVEPKQPIDAAPKQQQQQQSNNTPKPNKPSKTPSLNYDGEAWAAWAKSDAEINAKYAKLNETRNKYVKQGYVGDEAYQKAKDEINGVNQTNAGSNANGYNVMTLANKYMRQGMTQDQALARARQEVSMY